MTEELLRSLYLDALRISEEELCKDIIISKKKLNKSLDRSALFEMSVYASLLKKKLAKNSLYQAAISDNPFDSPVLLSDFETFRPHMQNYFSDGVLDLYKYRHDQILQKVSEEKRQSKELLLTLSIPDTILSNFDNYIRNAEEKICQFLKTNTLYVNYRKIKWPRTGSPLDSHNTEQFFLQLENRRSFPSFFLYVVQQRHFSDYIAHRVFDAFPILEHTPNIQTNNGTRLLSEIKDTASLISHDFYSRLIMLFPRERILELLRLNPNYRVMIEAQEKAEQNRHLLRSAMVDSIPEQYKDFYPAARMMHRRFILHIGSTNSGKTYDAINALMTAGSGVYLAPLRLLAYEQYEKINRAGIPCSLLTGEEQELVGYARIQSSTIEMADLDRFYDVAVIDEAQMIADPDRGGAWTSCILGLCAKEIHVCASRNAEKLLKKIIESCGDSVTVVHHKRQTPLMFESAPVRFPKDVRSGDALIVFSKRDVHAVSAELQKQGRKCSIIYGALPYDVRHKQAELFAKGENEIVVATDAIGMGMNLPIQRVVFLYTSKYDGVERRPLTSSEIKQIGGRAGRFGVYPKGYVATSENPGFIQHGLTAKDPPIDRATIKFPESLIDLNAPLVDILERWDEIDPHTGWDKASTGRMLFLAKRIQHYGEDNAFCYNFITLPFDESDSTLLAIWDNMVYCEHKGTHFDVQNSLPIIPEPALCRTKDLDNLEFSYRLCDLFYNYVRHFIPEDAALFGTLNQSKYNISSCIMHILSTQKLSGRRCQICKCPLPWNSPYKTCFSCYRRQFFFDSPER